jgi:hypothetical protein
MEFYPVAVVLQSQHKITHHAQKNTAHKITQKIKDTYSEYNANTITTTTNTIKTTII